MAAADGIRVHVTTALLMFLSYLAYVPTSLHVSKILNSRSSVKPCAWRGQHGVSESPDPNTLTHVHSPQHHMHSKGRHPPRPVLQSHRGEFNDNVGWTLGRSNISSYYWPETPQNPRPPDIKIQVLPRVQLMETQVCGVLRLYIIIRHVNIPP